MSDIAAKRSALMNNLAWLINLQSEDLEEAKAERAALRAIHMQGDIQDSGAARESGTGEPLVQAGGEGTQ